MFAPLGVSVTGVRPLKIGGFADPAVVSNPSPPVGPDGTVGARGFSNTPRATGPRPMSKGREIRCYDYVNHPYGRVKDVLTKNAIQVFQAATKAAAARAQSVAAELHVDVGGVGVKTDIRIDVISVQKTTDPTSGPTTRLML